MKSIIPCALCAIATLASTCSAQNQSVPIDVGAYNKSSGATITRAPNRLRLNWPTAPDATGAVVFDFNANAPLIESLSIQTRKNAPQVLAHQVNPVTNLTVGERDLKPGGWTIFFDNPIQRPHQTFPVVLDKKSVRVQSVGTRTTVRIGSVSAGSFAGDLQFTVYRNSPLLHVETVVQTSENGRAILYDTGLAGAQNQWQNWAWRDPDGALQTAKVDEQKAEPMAVAGRTLVAQSASGSLAVFPAPHQFFFPQDEAFNLRFVWRGRDYEGISGTGFGIRQEPEGDKRFVPWFNAPPNTAQRLGVFYLLSAGTGAQALAEVARYTNGDRFVNLPGYKTYSSHYHIEHTLELLRRQREENIKSVPQVLAVPGFVKTLKARGIDIAHLAEFHIGNTPNMKDDERLPLLKTLHEECARLSDAQLLVLPGERAECASGRTLAELVSASGLLGFEPLEHAAVCGKCGRLRQGLSRWKFGRCAAFDGSRKWFDVDGASAHQGFARLSRQLSRARIFSQRPLFGRRVESDASGFIAATFGRARVGFDGRYGELGREKIHARRSRFVSHGNRF